MNLIEAMTQAEHGQVVQRKYEIPNGMKFTMWGRIEIIKAGKFLKAGWGVNLKLEALEADNWEVVK